MKHTKKNVVKVLQAMYENYHALARAAETDKQKHLYIWRAIEISNAISLLTKKDFFEDFCKIHKITEDE